MFPNQCRSNFSDHVKKNSVGNSQKTWKNIYFCTVFKHEFESMNMTKYTFYLPEIFLGEVQMIETESGKVILFIMHLLSRRQLNINTFIWRPKIYHDILSFSSFVCSKDRVIFCSHVLGQYSYMLHQCYTLLAFVH